MSIREKIAREIAIIRGLIPWDRLPDKQTKECGCACKESCFKDADRIITIIQAEAAEKGWMKNKLCPHFNTNCGEASCPVEFRNCGCDYNVVLTPEDFK
jgi:hypothetical protein